MSTSWNRRAWNWTQENIFNHEGRQAGNRASGLSRLRGLQPLKFSQPDWIKPWATWSYPRAEGQGATKLAAPVDWDCWCLPTGVAGLGPHSQGLSHHHSQEQGSWREPGQPQTWALGISLGMGMGWEWAKIWLHMAGQARPMGSWRPVLLWHR